MSFRAAYHNLKRGNSTPNRALIRDRTPAEEKRNMDEYYQRMRNWTPSNGRK